MRRVFLGLTFTAFLSLFGSAVYYTTVVNAGTLAGAALFAILGTLAMHRLAPLVSWEQETAQRAVSRGRMVSVFVIGAASLAVFTFLAVTHPITTATRSLWLLFSPAHIALLSITFLCVLALSKTSTHLTAFLGGLLAFITSALAAFLFPLGFGFDPFLHRATLEHIATFGTITPKPLYYIGAYSLELVGNILLHLPLFSLDIFLAPLGLAVLVWTALRSKTFHPAFLALIPFAAFISTTPQAIGFLWVFALVIALKNHVPKPYLWLFALAAFAAHPLAGVPAVIFATLVSMHRHTGLDPVSNASMNDGSWVSARGGSAFGGKPGMTRISRLVFIIVTVCGIFAIPLMFFAQQVMTGMNVGFSWTAFTDFSRIPSLGFFSLHGNALMDTIMLFGGNLFFVTMILAVIGFVGCKRATRIKTAPLILAAIIALGNFVMLSLGFDFPFLISYERTDFALRLITIAWIFLLPMASDGIQVLVDAFVLRTQETAPRAVAPTVYATLLLAILFSAHVYVAYPRHDGYTRSAAFNVTAADSEIVHAIAEDADHMPYAVLSNQTLASAAIQELGFFQYYHGDIFAYPVPTSGPLYALFLDMIENTPTLNTVQQAKDLTGASRIYFAVHEYWWEADERIQAAKKLTDHWFASQDGTITVFVFE